MKLNVQYYTYEGTFNFDSEVKVEQSDFEFLELIFPNSKLFEFERSLLNSKEKGIRDEEVHMVDVA